MSQTQDLKLKKAPQKPKAFDKHDTSFHQSKTVSGEKFLQHQLLFEQNKLRWVLLISSQVTLRGFIVKSCPL